MRAAQIQARASVRRAGASELPAPPAAPSLPPEARLQILVDVCHELKPLEGHYLRLRRQQQLHVAAHQREDHEVARALQRARAAINAIISLREEVLRQALELSAASFRRRYLPTTSMGFWFVGGDTDILSLPSDFLRGQQVVLQVAVASEQQT